MLRSWLQHLSFTSITAASSSPRSPHSPLIFTSPSNPGSAENLSQSTHLSDSSSHDIQSSMDNVSIGSQSSAGFTIPVLRSSPQEIGNQSLSQSPYLGRSPDKCDKESLSSDSESRPETPLSFPLDAEETGAKIKSLKMPKSLRSHSMLSFSKLFPSSLHGAKTGQQELKERACEYCLRLLEQSERSKFARHVKKSQSFLKAKLKSLPTIKVKPNKSQCMYFIIPQAAWDRIN